MGDVTGATEPKRGHSSPHMRAFVCKDCQREVEHLKARLAELESHGASKNELKRVRSELRARREKATYNENWARNLVERGGSRSDRCKDHRQQHRINIQGLAVAYIDLKTVGEVADRENPTGPLGGLGPLPTAHEEVPNTSYDLQEVRVGMTDEHVVEMVRMLRDKQVLILKAGTGTGKSTFAPYRLMDPPPTSFAEIPAGAPFVKLTELGPIIVTEPRVQAAVGVASFVGGTMSGAGGVGPGYPVGYQVSGDRNHDEACELIYVTDGTMINWLREGRLSRIGTVIVDEAHERSTNIDFILGYLKRELPRYPHLRVIVTSATFNTDFYLEYFGGPAKANVMDVPPEKTFGYGMPFFPELDTPEAGEVDVLERWTDKALPLTSQSPRDEKDFIRAHWPTRYADPLGEDDVADTADVGYIEDVWGTTAKIMGLRFTGQIPMDQWRERMPAALAKFVIQLAKGLDEAGVYGDILAFLPTKRTIEPVCDEIEKALGRAYRDQVFPLISSLPKDRQKKALAKRRMGDARKIVISTNLAETSLTVEGVRFVVDSGIIAQSEWDPTLAKGSIPTKAHSQAGIKQRWGRVGRKAPGWVFPLYTKGQFLDLAEDTPPGSTRDNLEALVMTAKMGGIDNVLDFDWPAAFEPTTVTLDEPAVDARGTFLKELERADRALRAGGAVDHEGHPTSFGKELMRFQGLGSTASAIAIMYADRLACVPEVATVLCLLDDNRLIGQRGLLLDDRGWPDEWRLEAADRHRGPASLCEDDAELVLLIAAAWERADPQRRPWEDSPVREEWARQWWVNHSLLLEAAQQRHEVLLALSPAMKEDVKRFLEPALINRTRGVLTRAFATHVFHKTSDGEYQPVSEPAQPPAPERRAAALDEASDTPAGDAHAPSVMENTPFAVENDTIITPSAEHVVALRRREGKKDNRVSSLVIAQSWAQPASESPRSSVADSMSMIVAAAKFAPAEPAKTRALRYLESWPVGRRIRLDLDATQGVTTVRSVTDTKDPFPRPKNREERGDAPPRGGKPRRGRRNELAPGEEELAVTKDDLTTEIRLDPRRGYNDEAKAAAELLAADEDTDSPTACGQCFPCQDGRREACEQLGSQLPTGEGENPVQRWRRLAAGGDVSTPTVEVEREPVDSDGWYEVTSYHSDDGGYVVRVKPDWRRGQPHNAAQHPDLKPGDPVEVRVGRELRHHGGTLRAFDRIDGKGRFILAEATSRYDDDQVKRREIAVGLDRGSTSTLSGLRPDGLIIATVVPARAEGTLTITLLELLHQHWSKTADGRGAEYHVLDTTRRNTTTTKVYAALVETPPNPNGYVTASLLHEDSDLGVVHRFDFNVVPRGRRTDQDPQPEAEPTDEPTAPQLGTGDPVLLNLVSDRPKLDVSGLPIDELLDIERNSAGQLTIAGLPDDSTPDKRPGPPQPNTAHNDDDEGIAPTGTLIQAKTEKPLPRSAAINLAGLSDDPDWPTEVWSFWARSHHLRVAERSAYLPGTRTEPFNVPATVTVDHSTPLAQQQAQIADFANEHPVHSTIECIVRSLSREGVDVELDGGLQGFIPTSELSWASRIAHPDQVVGVGDRVQALITKISAPPGKPQLSIRALRPDPYEAFKRRHAVHDRVTAVVAKTTESVVFVDLGTDVDGSVHVSELDYTRIDTAANFAEPGTPLELVVLGFDDERRRVKLSRKAARPHPYDEYKARHTRGDKVSTTVERVSPTHVNVRHSNGAQGVLHVSQLAPVVRDATDAYEPGDTVTAKIVTFNDAKRQVELSSKSLHYDEYKARHALGDKVAATVHRTTDSHVFVTHANGALGVVYIGNLAWTRVQRVADHAPIGGQLTAEIIKFDDAKSQIELSVKALLAKPYPAYKARTPIGSTVSGVISKIIPAFAFVDLGGGVKGSIHISKLSTARISHPSDVVHEGQNITATIIGFNDARESVELALRPATVGASRSTMATRSAAAPRPASTHAAVPPVERPRLRSVVTEGDTVEAALLAGCEQLRVSSANVTHEVLDPGVPRRFLRPGRPARVRVTTFT